MTFRILIILRVILVGAIAGPAWASERVALVIGNAAYEHQTTLANPVNDATDIGAALDRLGFAVTSINNASKSDMEESLQNFKDAAVGADIAVVFYAGHGIEVDGENFLIPVDAELKTDRDIEFETVSLGLVQRTLEDVRGLGIVILDACRNNPFAAAMKQSGGSRSVGRGLARVEPSGSQLIAYAAKEGTEAADGTGRNSPYTTALLSHLEKPGLEVNFMFRDVRDAVMKATNDAQEPYVYGSLSGKRIYLAGRPSPSVEDPVQNPDSRPDNGVQEIEQLLMVCERHFSEGRFTSGASGNALACYRGVLSTDRANLRAIDGIEKIVDAYLKQGREALEQGSLFEAQRTLDEMRKWFPGGPKVVALGKEVDAFPAKYPAGSDFRDCDGCPVMVVIPAGEFMQGSPVSEEGRDEDEGPQRRVSVPSFALGVTEVTFEQWDRCVAAGGCSSYRPDDWDWGRGSRPVIDVSWHGAQEFVSWLNTQVEGAPYRLPSESEWEYAARAGTKTAYFWGDSIEGRNLASCSDCGSRWDGGINAGGQTAPVGSFKPNGFGLYDMHGNVWEWLEDCWNETYSGAPRDGSAWQSGDCDISVLRGGSWGRRSEVLRSANRGRGRREDRGGDSGFRVARTLSGL